MMTGRIPVWTGLFATLVLALWVWAPAASALRARFLVDGGDAYTRGSHVLVGDAGRTPFFSPGVVVWDGGSIVAGHGASPGHEYPVQTLAVLPRAVDSFVSSSPSAKIADMLADAPAEVDAHFDEDADLNVCVVLAGGGDFRIGLSAASVFAALETYCEQRHAAGFHVVVLSVLPSDRPQTFPAARLAFNTMLRSAWDEFADGFADVAGDPRIGDDGDQFDAQFYQTDVLHLTDAGQAVMAAVTAPVLDELPWLSRRCELRLRDVPGAWSDWRPWSAQNSIWLDDYQGEHLVEAEYRLDGGMPVGASDVIFLDSVRPEPRVLRNAVVRRRHRARLRYRIDDAEPCGPNANVSVQVRTRSGRLLKTLVRRRVPVNEPVDLTFTCTLPRGVYRWVVRARDTAGNPEAAAARGTLTVR